MTAACPACTVTPQIAESVTPDAMQFSLPSIHCAGCIGKIERGLQSVSGLKSVRINLSLKRLNVVGSVDPDDIIARLSRLGFEAYLLDNSVLATAADTVGRNLLLRMAVAGFAMMNVMLLSVAVWSGAQGATKDLFHLISAAIAVPVVIYSAQPFFRNAWSALVNGGLNMDVPISLAILLATGMSLFESLYGGAHAYFDAALSLTFFLLIGRYLDHITRKTSRSAAQELAALEVRKTQRVRNGQIEAIPTSDVALGDHLVVASGMRAPVDGTLLSAHALMDRSIITGESEPVTACEGAVIQAGEINLDAPITLRANTIAEDTSLRQMAALVDLAENGRNSFTTLADKAARIYAPLVHVLALVALLGWWAVSGDFRLSLNVAVAVLIITCPCALGLAVPSVNTAAISRLFSAGFLVKHATALERLAEIDYAVFDKTGTLSLPTITVPRSMSAHERAICRALALHSQHPLSRVLAQTLEGCDIVALEDVQEEVGKGVSATFQGQVVKLGRGAWLGAAFAGLGFAAGGNIYAFKTCEKLRPGTADAIENLDVPCEILTGDTHAAAAQFTKQLDVPYLAGLSATDKTVRLDALAASGLHCLMIGDGLNDTASLAKAHASLAPSSALEASRNAADIVLLKDSFKDLPFVLRTARAARRLSKQNFLIATLYNLIAVPIALMGFATPLIAAIAMSTSSITVILNSQRIRLIK